MDGDIYSILSEKINILENQNKELLEENKKLKNNLRETDSNYKEYIVYVDGFKDYYLIKIPIEIAKKNCYDDNADLILSYIRKRYDCNGCSITTLDPSELETVILKG